MQNKVIKETFEDYETSVHRAMTAGDAAALLAGGRPVMLKPNLVNATPPPVTTPPEMCSAVIAFVRRHTDAPIVIAEGCGDADLDTDEIFARLGYDRLAQQWDAELLDLNTAPLRRLTNDNCRIFPEMWLPAAVFEHILISLPVLKAHSLCRFTGSMKNMMGLARPEHYSGNGGTWKKATFHQYLDEGIVELNKYRQPDFTVMDATIGLKDYHLGGPCCEPPVNLILAGLQARDIDREASGLLGMDWRNIGHLA